MERFDGNYLGDNELGLLQHQHQPESENGKTIVLGIKPEDDRDDDEDEEGDEVEDEGEIRTSHQNIVDEAELLAAQAAAEAAAQEQQQQPGNAFNNVGQGLTGIHRDLMIEFWQSCINSIEHDNHDFKNHQLPLARIKKVMKTDEDVKMISAEAPILFAKGCDIFITELTMRAWIHAEENRRRTLQKSDIAAALTKSDMFDFLIDIVPREEEKPRKANKPNQLPEGPSGPDIDDDKDNKLLQEQILQGQIPHDQPSNNEAYQNYQNYNQFGDYN